MFFRNVKRRQKNLVYLKVFIHYFFFSVVFTFLTIVVAGVASAQFFKYRPVSSIIEVPWSLICYSFGEVAIICSDILFVLLIRKYLKHRRHLYTSNQSNDGIYTISLKYYPGRSNIHVNNRYRFHYFGNDEPPPDYDSDTLGQQRSLTKLHDVSRSGFKRIPRRYRHIKDVDRGQHYSENQAGRSYN